MKQRKSIVWSISDETFKIWISEAQSMAELLTRFNLRKISGNYNTCKKRIHELNLDISHFNNNHKFLTREKLTKENFLNKYIIEQKNIASHTLKIYLWRFGFKPRACEICGNTGVYMEKPLSLQLHHIDGNNINNSLNNLQILCPNCHSQSESFSGRKNKKSYNEYKKDDIKILLDNHTLKEACSILSISYKKLTKIMDTFDINKKELKSKYRPKFKSRKIERPSRETLAKLISEIPVSKVAKKYGVSDVAVSKWCKNYSLETPCRGFWAKKYSELH